jgi:hypothetical protein
MFFFKTNIEGLDVFVILLFKVVKIADESSPPLSSTPTGTSLTILNRTESSKVSLNHSSGSLLRLDFEFQF